MSHLKKRHHGRETHTPRRGVGVVIALLMLLHSIVASSAFAVQGHRAASGLASATAQARCDLSGADHDSSPAEGHHQSLQCCALCGLRDGSDHSPPCAAPFNDAFAFAGAPPPIAAQRAFGDDRESPEGWASSWSSRAPPLFS